MLVNSCETKLDGGQLVTRPGSSDSRWCEGGTDQQTDQRILQIQNFKRDYTGIQTPAKPLSPPSGAPHPEQYPLVFPTEILITQNPPKLRKVSLKVLDSAGAAEQKREITGNGERGSQMKKTFLRIFPKHRRYKWTLLCRTCKERDFENCDKRQYMSKLLEKNKAVTIRSTLLITHVSMLNLFP